MRPLSRRGGRAASGLVKAAGGRGGRGMRLVCRAEEVPDGADPAVRERQGLGPAALILEKLSSGRATLKFQVFARARDDDPSGERDVPSRRPNQKVIEGAPCPVRTEEWSAAMGPRRRGGPEHPV